MNKLKVLYISNNWGGAPKSLLNMIDSIKDFVEPIVLFPNKEGVYVDFENKGIKCIVVPIVYELTYNRDIASLNIAEKLWWYVKRCFKEVQQRWSLYIKLPSLLEGTRIDIVHTNTSAFSIGKFVANRLHAKHIFHVREYQDIDFDGFPVWGWRRLKWLIRSSDASIAISRGVSSHYSLSGLDNSFILWNAIVKSSAIEPIQQKENYILFAASGIVKGKGLHDLLVAYAHSKLPRYDIYLRIVGPVLDDSYNNECQKIIYRNDISNHVEWLGYRDDLKSLQQKAIAVIMPSYNEALGRVAIESMFYGSLVIARNSGGPSEYITNKVNGFLFNSVDELTNQLDYIVENDCISIVEHARKFSIDNFSEEVYCQKVKQIYLSLF